MDNNKLSKVISHALRHEPGKYNITLCRDGWANIDNVIRGLQQNITEYANLNLDDILNAVNNSQKKRHEIKSNKIRATYGHLTEIEMVYSERIPPDILYHGTSEDASELILSEGLKPMRRKYTHLSSNTDSAIIVGKRKEHHPVLLVIASGLAYSHGTIFYFANENVWLTKFVPSNFIQKMKI